MNQRKAKRRNEWVEQCRLPRDMKKELGGFAGVILAGGESRRMGGTPKAFIEIGGRPIIETTLALFERLFDEIVIATNAPELYSRFGGVRLVPDEIRGCGPPGGIHAALQAIAAPKAFFVACDMPFLDAGLVRRICAAAGENVECVVPRSAVGIEPLHAVYAKSLAPRFGTMLRAGTRRIRDVIDVSKNVWFELADSDIPFVANVNTPADLAALTSKISR
jgi:molybdopterin-guanine dinucleotide biosynthesis protein A